MKRSTEGDSLYFITDQSRKTQSLALWKFVGAECNGWERCYCDESTGQVWLEYYAYEDERSPTILRRKDLPQSMKELVVSCLTSRIRDDWVGLALHLRYSGVELTSLLSVLETNIDIFHEEAKRVFRQTFVPKDRRQLMGMSIEQISLTYSEFLGHKSRIAQILDK